MKKLIAIAVVFALAAGGVFAADLGGQIIGSIGLFQGDNEKDGAGDSTPITSFGMLSRWRIEGSGENDDGNFGAWIRLDKLWYQGEADDNGVTPFKYEGLAWWKPIDQFKMTIGGNSDGIFGKEGYAGWMFHQIVADSAVVNASQAWGCDYTLNAIFRDAFFGGFGGQGLLLEIKPVDMFGLNLVLPIWGKPWDGNKTSTFFKNMIIQADINLDFGNIALTFDMESWDDPTVGADYKPDNKIGGRMHLYFGLSAIDNVSLDVGVGIPLPKSRNSGYKTMDPIAFGVAAKIGITDAFGIKARVLAEFMGSTTPIVGDKVSDPFELIFEVLPFFSISDSVTIFADIGMNFAGAPDYPGAESTLGWHFNPYVQVGNEWGPSFFAGFKVWADGSKTKSDANKGKMQWAVPIALNVSL